MIPYQYSWDWWRQQSAWVHLCMNKFVIVTLCAMCVCLYNLQWWDYWSVSFQNTSTHHQRCRKGKDYVTHLQSLVVLLLSPLIVFKLKFNLLVCLTGKILSNLLIICTHTHTQNGNVELCILQRAQRKGLGPAAWTQNDKNKNIIKCRLRREMWNSWGRNIWASAPARVSVGERLLQEERWWQIWSHLTVHGNWNTRQDPPHSSQEWSSLHFAHLTHQHHLPVGLYRLHHST